jgi:hypothetical protein
MILLAVRLRLVTGLGLELRLELWVMARFMATDGLNLNLGIKAMVIVRIKV